MPAQAHVSGQRGLSPAVPVGLMLISYGVVLLYQWVFRSTLRRQQKIDLGAWGEIVVCSGDR